MLSIRKATSADCKVILELIQELADFEKLSNEVVATEEKLRKNLFEKNPVAFVLIAEFESQACGFALYFYNFSTFLGRPGIYLEDLYVKESHRSQGVGRALLVQLARIAKSENCGRLEWSVLKWNTKAIEFYLKIGAVPMDEWCVYRMTEKSIAQLADT